MRFLFIFYLLIFFFFVYYFFYKRISNSTINKFNKQKEIPFINNRTGIGYILEKENFHSIIEVGVQNGHFADELLSLCRCCKKYIMIDPWLKQKYYDDGANVPNAKQYKIFIDAMNIVNKYSYRTEFIILRTTSENAIQYLGKNFYDFVYLDGRHDYYSVKKDIKWYYPLLNDGGILAGHDYLDAINVSGWYLDENGNRNSEYKAVKSAVDEFAIQNGLKISLSGENNFKSWMIRKPNKIYTTNTIY